MPPSPFDTATGGSTHHEHPKLRQLCRQAHEQLDLSVSELGDAALAGAWVAGVRAAARGRTLVVEVSVPAIADVMPAYAALDRASAYLREELSMAIHRKRTPYLSFVVLPSVVVEPHPEGGDHG